MSKYDVTFTETVVYTIRVDANDEYESQYTITDEELTDKKLCEYATYCQKYGIDGDYLLASLITAKTFEMNKGGENV